LKKPKEDSRSLAFFSVPKNSEESSGKIFVCERRLLDAGILFLFLHAVTQIKKFFDNRVIVKDKKICYSNLTTTVYD
jgi:hypothetical protein